MTAEENFGRELRRLRRQNRRGLTLADAADEIGCSIALMSAIERGDRSPPSPEKIRQLLRFFGCDSEADRMIELAAKTRDSVEFRIKDIGPKATGVLLGLARRSEAGELRDGDPILEKIAAILRGEDDGDGTESFEEK